MLARLSVWAVFTVWSMTQGRGSGHAVLMFECESRGAAFMWPHVICDVKAHNLPRVQMGFKDVCNQLKHRQAQRTKPHLRWEKQTAAFTQVGAYIHQEGGTHSSWLDDNHTLTEESGLSTETGLKPEVCVSKIARPHCGFTMSLI